ncbi:patatin-like phospholipase domain-containing protein 7 isoform X1 [Watersipora subatra]|uniref:patatin-like phospholipase domain-containing protein 7 isoform X1 n=1 Tax=Watersipora subatra TaxID=2589382 RepID=UPI00355BE3FE
MSSNSHLREDLDSPNILSTLWEDITFSCHRIYQSENFSTYALAGTFTVCAAYFIVYFLFRPKVLVVAQRQSSRPRFRKRDKVQYYARKIFRKSKQVVNQARRPPQTRQEFLKLAKGLLRIRQRSRQLVHKDLPRALVVPDLGPNEDLRLPTEFIYLLRNVQVFGHLDQKVFLEINRTMQVVNYRANQSVFQIGDPDDCIYVVTSGALNVYIKEGNGEEVLVKEVLPGDSIYSLLSILDLLTGHEAPYKTVSARAVQDSTVLKVPGQSFAKAFESSPESMLRMVQIIMVRLIRVTFWALHNYLGLDHELMQNTKGVHDMLSSHGISTLQKSSSIGGSSEHDQQIKDLCVHDIAKILKIDDPSVLKDKITICHYPAGAVLCAQGDADADVTFVVKGHVLVSQKTIEKKDCPMFTAGPGEMVGMLATLSGEPSIFGIKTSEKTTVAHISKSNFYAMMKEQPGIVLPAAHLLVMRLSPFVRQIDFALDWMQVESGRAVFKKGDMSDHLYIILNGRIRTIMEGNEGQNSVSGEYGKGELIGIAEVITRQKRGMTAMAVRDTELAQVPSQLLEHIRQIYPQIITRLYHLLGDRLLGMQMRMDEKAVLRENPAADPRSPIANISTVAVVPASDSVPLTAFTLELQHALSSICHSLRLTSDIIKQKLGTWALDRHSEYRLSSWLAMQEDTHRTVIYQCDYHFTPWTQRCIRQSDVILIVALAEEQPKPGHLENALQGIAIRSQKELILLHRADATRPQNTVDWLNARDWCLSHHHVRCPNRVFLNKSPDKILSLYENVTKCKPDINSDMCRIARFLTGTAIGLVLGGGGARGASQIGLIKAMVECGIPIDMVGGTSIGSFVGALWCEERNLTPVIHRARQWFGNMNSLWKKIYDLTYPITSMMTGYSFNRSLEDVFGDVQIEDLWIPYFNITTDITASKMRVHTSGDLWRYVRSSMSLAGYLPPLCDPKDGHLLLDGGYVNNVPADVMKSSGASLIFAVDVGAIEDTNYTNYGDHLSGFWLLYKKWYPWAQPVRVPSMDEIQSRLAYISCEKNLEHIRRSGLCEYIRPPIDKFRTLQFSAFDEIFDCGYNFAKPYFAALVQTEKLKGVLRPQDQRIHMLTGHRLKQSTSCSLTDLANLISEPAAEDEAFSVFDLTDVLGTMNGAEMEETEEGDDEMESGASERSDDVSDED